MGHCPGKETNEAPYVVSTAVLPPRCPQRCSRARQSPSGTAWHPEADNAERVTVHRRQ